MTKVFNQLAFILLLAYCIFNLLNVTWLKLDLPYLIYWVMLCASFFVIRKLHTFASEGFSIPQPEMLAFGLVFTTFLAVFAQRIFLESYVSPDGVEVNARTFDFWGTSILWLAVGGACSSFQVKENTMLSVVIIVVMSLAFMNDLNDQLMIDWSNVNYEADIQNMSHLGMEQFVIIPLAFAFALGPNVRWLAIVCGVFFLYSMGGRTSLVMFIATVVFLSLRNNPVKNMLMLCAVSFVVWVGAIYTFASINIDFENQFVRDIFFMDGLGGDGSFRARMDYIQVNVNNFTDQFLFGDPALIVKQHGIFGGYIHNLLSAWEYYGFFVFVAFILLLSYCYRRMAVTLHNDRSPMHVFGAFMLLYVIGSVIISKSVLWTLLWFTLGFWLLKPIAKSHRSKERRKRRKRVYTHTGRHDTRSVAR